MFQFNSSIITVILVVFLLHDDDSILILRLVVGCLLVQCFLQCLAVNVNVFD